MQASTAFNPIRSNDYAELPDGFFSIGGPEPVSAAEMLLLNTPLLREYQLDARWFQSPEGLAILSGSASNPENPPIAMAYAGHQFGHRVPLLGDGRAHMLGQISTAAGPVDVQLKGSGRTVYSRGGDGRATLASVLREHLVSEAMAGLNIPSTRSLAVVLTGDTVYREQPEPGAILVRTARSHIRVGSFQHAANLGNDAVKALADHMITHHFPELHDSAAPYSGLLLRAAERQATLVARWMQCGFIHGVMNTDNMSLVGETIDFGPCAFMDEFNPDKVFSSIDRDGRYAWARQPGIALWNLTRFAEALLPLISDNTETGIAVAEQQLETFLPAFQHSFYAGLSDKLRLDSQLDRDHKHRFADHTLNTMSEQNVDMTVFFDTLTKLAGGEPDSLFTGQFADALVAKAWLEQWRTLTADDTESLQRMRHSNPAIIARNHRVAEALTAAVDDNNLQPFIRLNEALRDPYSVSAGNLDLQQPPQPAERVTATFCGT